MIPVVSPNEATVALLAPPHTSFLPSPDARRWRVVAIFGFANLLQGLLWALPGPLAQAHSDAYGVSGADVQLMVNLGSIIFLLGALPAAAALDAGLLHRCTLVSIALLTAATALRVSCDIYAPQPRFLLLGAAVLNGAAGLILMGGVAALVETWCPVGERGLATGFLIASNNSGLDVSFLLAATGATPASTDDAPLAIVRTRLFLLNATVFMAALLLLMIASVALPRAPRVPPSASAAAAARTEASFSPAVFIATALTLADTPGVLVAIAANGAVLGVLSSWQAVLSMVVAPLGIGAAAAGWLGFASSLLGNAAGVLAGAAVDLSAAKNVLSNHHRTAVVFAFALAGASFASFAAIATGIGNSLTTPALAALYATSIVGVVALCAAAPIVIELVVGAAFPAPEGSTLMLLCFAANATPVPLLFLPAGVGTGGGGVLSWALSATCAAAAAAIATVCLPPKRAVFDAEGLLTYQVLIPEDVTVL